MGDPMQVGGVSSANFNYQTVIGQAAMPPLKGCLRNLVVGGRLYQEPLGYDLKTGRVVTSKMGRHEGCATYVATEQALIYRGAGRQVAMWDTVSGDVTAWERLRPGCWLSTIAAGGAVLSPEGGGGCSCGNWMETSLAFVSKDYAGGLQ